MTASIHAPFDFAEIGTFSVSFTDSGGTAAIQYTTGSQGHVSFGSVVSGILDPLRTRLQTSLNANATLAGTYAVAYSNSTGKYTIGCSETFSMTFTLPSVGSRVLGFTANKSGSTSYVADARAYYSITLAHGGISGPSDDYEPDGYAEDAYTEGGDHYGIYTGVPPTFYDFVAPLETKAKSFKRSVTTAEPWAYQHFWEYVRNVKPFALVTDSETSVLRLRAEGTAFRPQRVSADYDDLWTHSFRTTLRGRV